jgi:hypothetical protein
MQNHLKNDAELRLWAALEQENEADALAAIRDGAAPAKGREGNPLTALHFAAQMGSVKLIEHALSVLRIDPNEASCGVSPLHLAALSGRVDAVGALLRDPLLNVGLSTSSQMGIPMTALMLAARNGDEDCVAALMPRSDVDAFDEQQGFTALMRAIEAHSESCAKRLAPSTRLGHRSRMRHTAADLARSEGMSALADFLDALAATRQEEAALETVARAGSRPGSKPFGL